MTEKLAIPEQAAANDKIPQNLREAAGERIISELDEYIKAQGPLPYAQAESEMARTLAHQISNGSKEINLSQHYATKDATTASERHQQALMNLMPLLQDAATNGYRIEHGQALTQGIRQAEVLAISSGFKMSSSL